MSDTIPRIGKDVIESLTLGMYEDCRIIYREYIQNAADAIDTAIGNKIIKNCEGEIFISIDKENKKIRIEDNGIGISHEKVYPILCNIAHSLKRRDKDKGFRGIGRLGGLAYCETLTFETSFCGENIKSIMRWDAKLLTEIINNREKNEDAIEVIKGITTIFECEEEQQKHYFHVVLEGVTEDKLLDIKNITDYLSMVAPVDISSHFIYRNKINYFMRENNIKLDKYNLYINNDQIFRPYTADIYEDNNGIKRKIDNIIDIECFIHKDNNSIIYWGWYSLSHFIGQMKSKNYARGIRLRKGNIQIGDEEICKKFFTNINDQRFSFYFFGEIHVLSVNIIPNSRRDYFIENESCKEFEKLIKIEFQKLREICYDALHIRKWKEQTTKLQALKLKINEKEEKGFTSIEEKEELQNQLDKEQKREEEAKKKYDKVKIKVEETNSPLKKLLKKEGQSLKNKFEVENQNDKDKQPHVQEFDKKIQFRTDNPQYSKYSKKEKKLITKIYTAISQAIAEEDYREAVINHIEQEITK